MRSRIRRAGPIALASVVVAACGPPAVAELYPQLQEHSGRLVGEVVFLNAAPFSRDSLRAITEAEPTHCDLVPILFPYCLPGTRIGLRVRRVDLETIGRDVARLTALYRQSGYFGTMVVPDVEPMEAGLPDPVRVTYRVDRGPAILVDTVIVEGTEGIADPDSLAQRLQLQPGRMFELPRLLASSDQVVEVLRGRGHAYAQVLRNYEVDATRNRATAWLVAIPGPRVTVDSILVLGADVLDRGTVRRQLEFTEGDLLVLRDLRESQRNLFDLELVQFAMVAVADDTLQLDPDDNATATVVVQITEAPEYVVEAMAGFGTQDCIRTGAQWSDRSFIHGARRLTLSASVSRLASTLCDPPDTLFARGVDYRAAAELVQPYFLGARNRLAVRLFAEQQTQPGLFRRISQGGRVSFSRHPEARQAFSGAVDIEYRGTEAVPVLYCFAFAICTPEDIAALGQARWRNALGASWYRDRSNRPVSPSDGYILRTSGLWATPYLASDYDFLRGNIELSAYRSLRPGWVGAGYLRVGSFLTRTSLGAEDFVPPEERFYAGGANSVRGLGRNQLGPGVWLLTETTEPDEIHGQLPVQFFPTGGTSLVVASGELRFPAPWLAHLVRMAAFVDAGMIGLDPIWAADEPWVITPGAGVRIQTPIGPLRMDVGYNPHAGTRGPLLMAREDGVLVRIAEDYRPDPPRFWRRLQFHVAVGQAF